MKKWKVAIFDWNGTLSDDLYITYKAVKRIFRDFNLPEPSFQDFRSYISTNFLEFYKKFGISINKKSINRMRSIRKKIFLETKSNLRDGSLKLIKDAYEKGLKLAIISGEDTDILNFKLKESGLNDFFSFVRSGVTDKEKSLMELITFFSINPDEAFFVDDSYDGNFVAKKLGILTIAFVGDRSYSLRERIVMAMPDFIFTKLSTISKLL